MRYNCRTQGRLPGIVMRRLMTGSCLGGASWCRDYDLFIVLIIVRTCMERCSQQSQRWRSCNHPSVTDQLGILTQLIAAVLQWTPARTNNINCVVKFMAILGSCIKFIKIYFPLLYIESAICAKKENVKQLWRLHNIRNTLLTCNCYWCTANCGHWQTGATVDIGCSVCVGIGDGESW